MTKMKFMDDLLKLMFEKGASDLHLVVGSPPVLRINGDLVRVNSEDLTKEQCRELICSALTDEQIEKFDRTHELDISFSSGDLGRIRMNVGMQRGTICAALRAISYTFKTFEELGLPKIVYDILRFPSGLVLVTGPTGSGKSTTLAAMINYLNDNRRAHIITIEDPIEYVHTHKKCIVRQRELGADTESFSQALKHVMRQDPDIVLIGEMRDKETIETALTIAETGHLVLATLHTTDAAQTINRIIDVFPSDQQTQIRSLLSMTLQAVMCQKLVKKRVDEPKLTLATEVLMVTSGIRNMIREMKIEQMHSAIEMGAKFGMHTMDQALYKIKNET